MLNARPGAPPWVIVLPFEPTNCAWSPTPPSAAATSGSASDPGERRLRERRRVLGAPEGLLAGHDRVRPGVRGRVDRVEPGVDRVGEDERAADHRDAHDDRERGQDQPELAPEDVLERDADHDAAAGTPSSSFIVFSTSAAVAPVLIEDDLAVGEVEDAVGDRGGARVVGDHDDRLPVGVAAVAEQREDLGARSRVEVAGRLVGEDRPSAARRASARPRPAAAGRRRARSAGACGGATSPTFSISSANHFSSTFSPAIESGSFDVLLGVQHREQVVELEDEADVLAPQVRELVVVHARDLLAGDVTRAARRLVEPGEDVHQRRLARARTGP